MYVCMYVCMSERALSMYVCMSDRSKEVYVCMSEAPEHVCMYVCMSLSNLQNLLVSEGEKFLTKNLQYLITNSIF